MEYCRIIVKVESIDIKLTKRNKTKIVTVDPWYEMGEIFSFEKVVLTGDRDVIAMDFIEKCCDKVILHFLNKKNVLFVEVMSKEVSCKYEQFKNCSIKECMQYMTPKQFQSQFGYLWENKI